MRDTRGAFITPFCFLRSRRRQSAVRGEQLLHQCDIFFETEIIYEAASQRNLKPQFNMPHIFTFTTANGSTQLHFISIKEWLY